jgi:hypothetical protein
MIKEVKTAFDSADYPETIRVLDRHFGGSAISLRSLFKDEQRRILSEILASTHEDLESRFRLISERYTPLMQFLQSMGAPLPPGLETVREYVLHEDIRRRIEGDPIDFEGLSALIQEAQARNGRVLDAGISFAVKNRMEQMIQQVAEHPEEPERIIALDRLARLVVPLPLGLNLWKVQNTYWELLHQFIRQRPPESAEAARAAETWTRSLLELGSTLGFAPNSLRVPEPRAVAA